MSFGDFFLKNPGSFPNRLVGTHWGGETLGVALAGLSFQFSGLSRRQADYVRKRYADFLAEAPGDDTPLVTEVYHANPEGFLPLEVRPWVYTMDMDYQPSRVRIAGLQLMAIIDCKPKLRAALWSATEEEADFQLVFENVFRMLTAYALLHQGGVLLHSAGLSDGDTAWIGFGHSGAGKSTLSRLSLEAGKQVLSDDINAIRCESGQWRAQRIPFAGELGPTYGQKGSYTIHGLCRLYKGAEHRLERVDRAQGIAALVASAPYVNKDPYRVVALMAILEALLDAVPCYRLTFSRDPGFWRLLAPA